MDGHLCLALEHCEISLYSLIQERVKPHGGCVSPSREARAGEVFSATECSRVGHEISAGLAYLHNVHQVGRCSTGAQPIARSLCCSLRACRDAISLSLAPSLRHCPPAPPLRPSPMEHSSSSASHQGVYPSPLRTLHNRS